MKSQAAASPELAPGWRAVEKAGEGGAGVVYHAVDRASRHAAVKLVTELGDEGALVAFLGRRWGPSLLDAGRTSHGFYLAMEWSAGAALDVKNGGVKRAAIAAHSIGRA